MSENGIFEINQKVKEIFKDKIPSRSFNSVLKKCINNYKKGTVPNYENYLITSIENKIIELENAKERNNNLSKPYFKLSKKTKRKEIVPEWLLKEQENSYTQMNRKHYFQNKLTLEEERKKLNELLDKYKK
ncbi:hypothetical protein [Bacillus thuringiensis]|uniref:hypothetical protein n=1 Tax=Bacillus thuringiensis TaxID=1428 RepID=UPI0026E17E7C|nr:hypothetical protein [Bacillus thuringiensis]MDO6632224.1 hypothetical protein [Bacillus thuringiensis]MDO6663451.1 hypothetical protein [Bacillus thuringiensis]MDO6702420.1 hypothetical protein [Bacillus thuringiensis]